MNRALEVRAALRAGDVTGLRRLLAGDPSLADALVPFGPARPPSHHPLHYICDVVFEGLIGPATAVGLTRVLIKAGSTVDFRVNGGETALIAAPSLDAEAVGLCLLDAGADPALTGGFGELALHWAAHQGWDRLARRLIPVSDIHLQDARYQSTPLGWALHGWEDAVAEASARYIRVVRALVAAGAEAGADDLSDKCRANPDMMAALALSA